MGSVWWFAAIVLALVCAIGALILGVIALAVVHKTRGNASSRGRSKSGPTGATGMVGPTGSEIAGATGPQGIPGSATNTGATGVNGLSITGSTGFTGPQGIPGSSTNTGSTGVTGNAGSTGATGTVGPTGSIGNTGPGLYTFESPLVATGSVVSFAELLPANSETVYVSAAGSNVSGNGSPTRPYATVQFAVNSIADSSSTKPYIVQIGPGTFTSTNLGLPPWVFLVGSFNIGTKIIDTSGVIDLAVGAAWSSGSQRSGVNQLSFLNGTSLRADFQAIGGSGSNQIYLYGSQVNGGITLRGRGSDNLTMFDCTVFGVYQSSAMQEYISSAVLANNANWDTTGFVGTTYAPVLIGSSVFGSANISAAAGSTMEPTWVSNYIPNGIDIADNTVTLFADSTSIGGGISASNGASFEYISNAIGVGYVATGPNIWANPAPVDVQDAITRLSVAVAALRGSPIAMQELAIPEPMDGPASRMAP